METMNTFVLVGQLVLIAVIWVGKVAAVRMQFAYWPYNPLDDPDNEPRIKKHGPKKMLDHVQAGLVLTEAVAPLSTIGFVLVAFMLLSTGHVIGAILVNVGTAAIVLQAILLGFSWGKANRYRHEYPALLSRAAQQLNDERISKQTET